MRAATVRLEGEIVLSDVAIYTEGETVVVESVEFAVAGKGATVSDALEAFDGACWDSSDQRLRARLLLAVEDGFDEA